MRVLLCSLAKTISITVCGCLANRSFSQYRFSPDSPLYVGYGPSGVVGGGKIGGGDKRVLARSRNRPKDDRVIVAGTNNTQQRGRHYRQPTPPHGTPPAPK